MQICMFCGGDASDAGHRERCDGRQGHVEDEPPLEPEPALLARGSDPETSHAAMAAFDRETMSAAADLVVRLHIEHGPLADYELRVLFGRTYQPSCCAHLYRQARSTARDRGQIRDSGFRKVDPTTHRHQVVWEACADPPPVIHRCAACGHLLRRRAALKS